MIGPDATWPAWHALWLPCAGEDGQYLAHDKGAAWGYGAMDAWQCVLQDEGVTALVLHPHGHGS